MKRLLLMVVCGVLTCNAFAADAFKVGVVNVDEVILKSPLGMSFSEKLANDFKPRQEALTTAQRKLQDDVDQLTFNGYKLSQDDRNKLQATINTEKTEVDAMNSSMQKDFNTARAQFSQTLMTQLSTVINKIAKEGHYDIIQTTSNLMYLNPAVNITSQVTDQLK